MASSAGSRSVTRRFSQVDVFTSVPLLGNPLAVIHDADGLTTDQMAAVARWTNLSETTFLLSPIAVGADYRVRIFTTGGELPFAGHPTIGSCHAWLGAGGEPVNPDRIIQECGAGLVEVKKDSRLAFAAPELTRFGEPDAAELATAVRALRIEPASVLRASWIDNGPGWLGLELRDAAEVLAAEPDPAAFTSARLKVGIIGRWRHDDENRDGRDVEVRAFYADGDFAEDPVTGSLNAGLAQWLMAEGQLPTSYVAGQGSRRHRNGRVYLSQVDGQVWVGGDAVTVVRGTIDV